jgi:hypothetical protein
VVDALSGDPIRGLEVACDGAETRTDPEGRFRVPADVDGEAPVVIRDPEGRYFGYVEPRAADLAPAPDGSEWTLPALAVDAFQSGYYEDGLAYLEAILRHQDPHQLPEPDYSLPGEVGERWVIAHLDALRSLPLVCGFEGGDSADPAKRRAVIEASEEWEARSGLDLFEWRETEGEEGLDVVIDFSGSRSATRFAQTSDYVEGRMRLGPLTARVELSRTTPAGRELSAHARHELGHVLFLFGHSDDPNHVMYRGGATTQRVSEDEGRAVRFLYSRPEGALRYRAAPIDRYRRAAEVSARRREESSEIAVFLVTFIVAVIVFRGLVGG